MVHLRVVAPPDVAQAALEVLRNSESACNIVHVGDAVSKPDGDLVLADLAREDASVIIGDLRELGIPESGSITLAPIEAQLSEHAERAELHATGLPGDAVIWEDVESRAEEMTELSTSFVAFMVLAMLIASIGLLLDQPILIIGAMVLGPEFGPLAALCVAIVHRQRGLARRSLVALVIGFPIGILATVVLVLLLRLAGQVPEGFDPIQHPLTSFIARPDLFSFLVAFIAGIAGVLSLTTAKSGALIGVLISVTTIPAAANIGVAIAFGEVGEMFGAIAQLSVNLAAIIAAGVLTLFIQRRTYMLRRVSHLSDPTRGAAGLPVGSSSHQRRKPGRTEPGADE